MKLMNALTWMQLGVAQLKLDLEVKREKFSKAAATYSPRNVLFLESGIFYTFFPNSGWIILINLY